METPEKNVFDHYKSSINFFLKLDENTISELKKVINEKGANLSTTKINKIIKSGPPPIGSSLRGALSMLVHQYLHHKENYEQELSECSLNQEEKKKIKEFIESLSTNGLEGMNIRSETRYLPIENTFTSLASEVSMRAIHDEEGKLVAFLPILRCRISVLNQDEDSDKITKFDLELDELTDIIDGLTNARNDFIKQAKEYKNNIKCQVIITNDE